MNKKYQKIFVGIIFALLALPMTFFIGISETTTTAGTESITPIPSIQEKSFQDKKFQPLFESWWNSHFAFRKTMLKTKNTIYDWANFGKIHSGSQQTIIQGKENIIYQKVYFNSFKKNCSPIPDNLKKLKDLKDVLQKKNIELFVILAPNKAVTYPELIPLRYKYFLGDECKYYDKLEQKITEYGIPVYNAQKLMHDIRKNEDIEPFNKTGTHWNFYGAGRAVQESAKHFNWGDIKIKEIQTQTTPYFTERDFGNLLNLWYKYYPNQTFYKPIFDKVSPLSDTITIISNSFGNEYKKMFIDAGLSNGKLNHYENKPLTSENIPLILKSNKIILIYTDDALITANDQFYKKIDFLLNNIQYITNYKFSDKKRPNNLYTSGLSNPESWGAWSNSDTVEFTLTNMPNKNLIIRFDTRGFLEKQRDYQNAKVYINNKYITKWQYKRGKPLPNTVLEVSAKQIKNGEIKIRLEIENPVSPKEIGHNNDGRKLAIGFHTLTVEEK